VLCARTPEPLANAADQVSLLLRPGQSIEIVPGNVADPDFGTRLITETEDRWGRVDVLVNNAGVYGPMGPVEAVDWDDWIEAVQVNLVGSVLMCRAVIPAMKRQRAGKIVQLSGGGATSPMPYISAYAVSKAGIVRFVETLAGELREFGIDVNAIAPGALNTRMLDEVLARDPDDVGDAFHADALRQRESGGAGLDRGADLAIFLASTKSDGITGRLVSAIWDDWSTWPQHLEELRTSDVYTLRRIAGRDRGITWGDK
jgi:NAD(P)-dependent dehydrogenase (short-subunit alcohol dehydrogenase family)